MERRLTTILAADMVGYSRLMSEDEEGVIKRLKEVRAELIDPAITGAGGRIVKTTGDGILAEFPSATSAARVAISVQNIMLAREAGRPEDERFRFRVGINTGEVVVDGEDLLGDCINIAARLESLAPPGGICVGRSVHDQIGNRINAPLKALGPQLVKNIPEPVEVWRVEIAGALAPIATKKAERPSVAVLPFDNMSLDPDQEFLADGIVEDVITELSRFRSLRVIARNSTFAFKGSHKDVRQIADELDVRYVVEGSVRRAGDRLRVTAQLIEAQTGAHLWAERWDRDMADLFDVQDELTSAIVGGVEPELGAHERILSRRKPTSDLSAWELCQRGLATFMRFSDDGLDEAEIVWRQASEIDPSYSLAHTYLALVRLQRAFTGRTTDRREEIKTGIESSLRALDCDDRNHLAYEVLGMLMVMDDREDQGESWFARALALNPNCASTYMRRSLAALTAQNPDPMRIIDDARRALELSPRDPGEWSCHIQIACGMLMRDPDDNEDAALREALLATQHINVEWMALSVAALLLARRERVEEASRLIAEACGRKSNASFEMLQRALPSPALAPVWRALEDAALLLDSAGFAKS